MAIVMSNRTFQIQNLSFMVLLAGIIFSFLPLKAQAASHPKAFNVITTTPTLGSLVRQVGGPWVKVDSLVSGREDPWRPQVKSDWIIGLKKADLLVLNGLGLEEKWLAPLIKASHNRRIQFGAEGYLDSSSVIEVADPKSQGILFFLFPGAHQRGNPHYLLDPLGGVAVARLVQAKLTEMVPEGSEEFQQNFLHFEEAIAKGLVGEDLSRQYDYKKMAKLFENGRETFFDFLDRQGVRDQLGGWLGMTLPYYGTRVFVDHDGWPYFARRFGIRVVDAMEARPGRKPSHTHLNRVSRSRVAENVQFTLILPYYEDEYQDLFQSVTKTQLIPMAHQVGSRENTETYVQLIGYNVNQLIEFLSKNPPSDLAETIRQDFKKSEVPNPSSHELKIQSPKKRDGQKEDLEMRLHRLNEFRRKNLISEEEYQKIRKEIIEQL